MNNILKSTTERVADGAKITLKLIIILGMILILLIPQEMVKNLIHDREYRQQDIERNIAAQIGSNQDIVGPILCIPYIQEESITVKDNQGKEKTEIEKKNRIAYFSAESLNIQSDVDVENKEKAIYKVPFFQSENQLSGHFVKPDFTTWEIDEANVRFNEAFVILGISDLKGISGKPVLNLGSEAIEFQPGTKNSDILPTGIHAELPENWQKNAQDFQIQFDVRGTSALNFASTAKSNSLSMTSNWPHPNFESTMNEMNAMATATEYSQPTYIMRNNTLPTERVINEDNSGFNAEWNESQFSLEQPSQWLSTERVPNFYSRLMGTEFINVADHYNKTDRSVKYMALVISLVFLSFFLIELLKQLRVHPFQYIMIGSAIAVFFVLLLAISEYLGFNLAYLIAAISTIALIGIYSVSVLKSKPLASAVSLLLAILFTFIFVILIAVDYSLLIGAIGLFVIIAIVMYATRNVNWYGVEK